MAGLKSPLLPEQKRSDFNIKSGWSQSETELLLSEVRKAESEGSPLKTVFDKVAMITGRKPNSIRNYYYMKIRQSQELDIKISSFIPFTQQEVKDLMIHTLTRQYAGKSVRSIMLEMAGGDKKNMLRYQNKYRSTIKNSPEYVNAIIEELKEQNIPCYNPYEKSAPESNLSKKSSDGKKDIIGIISDIAEDLNSTGQDAKVLLRSIGSLAKIASDKVKLGLKDTDYEQLKKNLEHSYQSIRGLESQIANYKIQISSLARENKQLSQNYAECSSQLSSVKEMTALLEEYLKKLVYINKDFIELNSMNKISFLSSYLVELENTVFSIEKNLAQLKFL